MTTVLFVRVTELTKKEGMLFWEKHTSNKRGSPSLLFPASICNTYSISLAGFLIVLSHCLEKLSKMESKEFCLKQEGEES